MVNTYKHAKIMRKAARTGVCLNYDEQIAMPDPTIWKVTMEDIVKIDEDDPLCMRICLLTPKAFPSSLPLSLSLSTVTLSLSLSVSLCYSLIHWLSLV